MGVGDSWEASAIIQVGDYGGSDHHIDCGGVSMGLIVDIFRW